MSIAIWPSELPQAPVYGFTEQRQRNIVAFKPDAGPPKMRRASSAAAIGANATFVMADSEVEIFSAFFEIDLQDGTLPFTWIHPVNLRTYTWIFASDEAPSIERSAPNINNVQCKLIRLP